MVRSLRRFAEEEIVVPEGRFGDLRYRISRLPWTGLLFDEIDSGRWRRFVVTGNVQGGKTLNCFVIPTLWHLFEHREAVVCGVPEMRTAGDKWRKELLPSILAQPRFARHLPQEGAGSQGGFNGTVTFGNGAELRFMGGTGGDETRSNYTARIATVTEADRLDVSTLVSREAAPIFQIEARTLSYDELARFYAECTVTIESGFVWRELKAGSDSRIVCPCAHCEAWVSPERDDLIGWHAAEHAIAAAEAAAFACPVCRGRYSDAQRESMNASAVLVHRGQTIAEDGEIVGEPPQTYTLGFRWSAFNNLLWTTAHIAENEWRACHDADSESGERKMRQWFWVIPIEPDETPVTPLTTDDVLGRAWESLRMGMLPPQTEWVSAGIDVRKSQVHFVVTAWLPCGSGRVVDLGIVPVNLDRYGVRRGLRMALRVMAERLNAGYPRQDNPAERLAPGWAAIDAGYRPDEVRAFVREQRAEGVRRFIPSWGRGQSQNQNTRQYRHPEATSPKKPHIGEQYYIGFDEAERLHGLIVNADAWKQAAREALAAPVEVAGAIATFEPATEHEQKLLRQFARENTAEQAKEIVVPGRGLVIVFENLSRRPNHFGDGFYLSCATGHLCGVRVVDRPATPSPPAAAVPLGAALATTPTGQPYLLTDREAA